MLVIADVVRETGFPAMAQRPCETSEELASELDSAAPQPASGDFSFPANRLHGCCTVHLTHAFQVEQPDRPRGGDFVDGHRASRGRVRYPSRDSKRDDGVAVLQSTSGAEDRCVDIRKGTKLQKKEITTLPRGPRDNEFACNQSLGTDRGPRSGPGDRWSKADHLFVSKSRVKSHSQIASPLQTVSATVAVS
jgi:hypothetical protein